MATKQRQATKRAGRTSTSSTDPPQIRSPSNRLPIEGYTRLKLSIDLPDNTATHLYHDLRSRGISLEQLVTVYLTSFVVVNERGQMLIPSSILHFGKYRGNTLDTVIRADPKYVAWCLNNLPEFVISPEAHTLLTHLL